MLTRLAQLEIPIETGPPTEGTESLPTPHVEFVGIGPEVAMAAAAIVIVMLLALVPRWPVLRKATLPVAFIGLAAAGVLLAAAWSDVTTFGAYETLKGMVAVDGFALFLKFLVLVAAALGLLVAESYLRREDLDASAYHALLLLSAAGMLMMASANDLIVVFLALEVLSIALYVLAAFHRGRAESEEAGIKYFVMGAFSSAVFLYGIAFVYGATGTTSLTGIAQFLAGTTVVENAGLLVGIALIRVLQTGLETQRLDWEPLVWVLAVLTLAVGSVLAIVQTNVKRMLAYSSISHAGFILIGVQAGTDDGVSAALTYLFAYTFIVLGTFAVVTVMSQRGDVGHDLSDYRGLSRRSPLLAATLTVLLFAQAGMPLTSGFVAKLTVFRAAVNDEQYALVIVGVLVAVVAAFVYLRLLVVSYLEDTGDDDTDASPVRVDPASGLALVVAGAFTLAVGFAPNVLLDFADRATLLF